MKIFIGCMALSVLCCTNQSHAQRICVFDPLGSAGEIFFTMKDFGLFAKRMKVDIALTPYQEEEKAIQAFKRQDCDGVLITDVSARPFNHFAGSMNAIGAITNHHVAKAALNLMDHPKLAGDLQQSNIEVAGFLPIGIVRLIAADKNINQLQDVQGQKVAVMSGDSAQYQMVKKIGGQPVVAHIEQFAQLFATSQVSIIGLPALALEPFEVFKMIGSKGGITNYPATFVSMNLLIKQDRFPNSFGMNSRSWFKSQYDRMFKTIELAEKKIKPEYWININPREAEGYDRIVREMRIRLMRDDVYNKKMLVLLKKIRCQQNNQLFECTLHDE